MEYKAIFFNKIAEVFFFRTNPASNMAKPKAMNITSIPQMINRKVLNTNAVSEETAALATPEINTEGIKKDRIFFILA